MSVKIANDPRGAIEDVDIVILATNSGEPVIQSEWIMPGTHINSVGPKFKDRHELPTDIDSICAAIYTDSLKQLKNYPKEHFLSGKPSYDQIAELHELVSSKPYSRIESDITLFLSVGLSRTEPAVANLLLQ